MNQGDGGQCSMNLGSCMLVGAMHGAYFFTVCCLVLMINVLIFDDFVNLLDAFSRGNANKIVK